MTVSEQQRANRLYYLSIGKCPRCGGANKVAPGRPLCVECQNKHDTEQDERRKRWKSEGRCIRCGREAADGKAQCQKCLDDRNAKKIGAAASKRRRDKLRMMGFCQRCGRTWAEPGRSMCKACLAKHRKETSTQSQKQSAKARRQARIEAGLCIDCGAPADGKRRCPRCRELQLDRTRKWKITKRIEREAEQARRANSLITPIEEKMEHKVSEVICVKCSKRWLAVRPVNVWLKELECPNCGAGYVIETGQELDEE